MANRNYTSGRRFEYEVATRYREEGYEVMRTAGSHGLFDLIAIKPGRHVDLIQCKVTTSPATAARLLREFKENPPIEGIKNVHQIMEVRIKGSSDIQRVII